jgi:hypothetical protein
MRVLRIGAIVLVVLAALFVAADRIALNMAEDEAADKIKNSRDISATGETSVDIEGFPFLTQVAGNDVDDVDAKLGGLRTKAAGHMLKVTRIDAHLRHVHFKNGYSSATAEQATGTALVPYEQLAKAAGHNITVGWGGKNAAGKGRVRVTGSIEILGHRFARSVDSIVSATGGNTVRVRAEKVPGAGMPGIEGAIRKRTDFSRKISGLPSGLKLERVAATRQGIELSIRGSGVRLFG